MFALRRTANPLRNHGHFVAVARSCSTKSVTPPTGHGPHCHQHCPCRRTRTLLKPSSSSSSSSWAHHFSSQSGPKSSDEEQEDDELDAGFSDLDNNVKREVAVISDGEEMDDDEDFKGKGKEVLKIDMDLVFGVLKESPASIGTFLNQWVADGKPLGRIEIGFVIGNLRQRKLYYKALQVVEWVETTKHIELVERDYSSHVDLIAKVHGIQRCENKISKIPKEFRNEKIYRTLLANCVAAGNIKKAEEVFNKMRDLGFSLTIFSCNQLLLLYKRVDRKKVYDVLEMMEKENIKPSLFTYGLLIDTSGREKDISRMEETLEVMKGAGMQPDTVIQTLIVRHYIFNGFNGKAEATLKEMEGDDIKNNRDLCKTLLPLYAQLGKADDVGRIWKVCEADPRLDECLAGIEAWGKLGQIEDAEKIFEHMMDTWKKLSSRHYDPLLKVYANNKLVSKGKDLVKRMSDNGCRIGPMTWDALVKLYVEAGEVEKADSILDKATLMHQIKPIYSSYMTVMDQYAKKGDVHNAEKIFNRLRQTGYAGRIRQYQSLLQTYINAKVPAYGFRERMKADNLFPNKVVAAQLMAVDAFKKAQIPEMLD